jgi:hypothetical protein
MKLIIFICPPQRGHVRGSAFRHKDRRTGIELFDTFTPLE